MSTFVVADNNKCEDLTPSEDMKKRNLDQRERGVTQNDHRRGCHCSGAFTRQEKKNILSVNPNSDTLARPWENSSDTFVTFDRLENWKIKLLCLGALAVLQGDVLGWKLNSKSWRHFRIVGSNVTKKKKHTQDRAEGTGNITAVGKSKTFV